MLPKANRLKKKKDFEQIFKKGKRFKENSLVFITLKNDLKNSRFGFIISKNVSKKTTLRNKIKRKLRELVRTKLKKIKKRIDGVLIVQPGLENKDFWEIEEALNKIFKRAKIF